MTVSELPASATFECELSKATAVQWLKDDKPITPSNKYKITSDGSKHKLVVKDVTGEDSGVYTLSVKDKKTQGALSVEGMMKNGFQGILNFFMKNFANLNDYENMRQINN